tara:strand:- start:73 stop:474 length:402 start_codon:yes stop_codon:yes gene_type:complete
MEQNKNQLRWKEDLESEVDSPCIYHGSINQNIGFLLTERLGIDKKMNKFIKDKIRNQLKIKDIDSKMYTDEDLWDRWAKNPHKDAIDNAEILDVIDEKVFFAFLKARHKKEIKWKTEKGAKIIAAIELIRECL